MYAIFTASTIFSQNIMGHVTLTNGIEATIVKAEGDTTSVAINISGGLCATNQKPGLDSLITTIYAKNIRSQLANSGYKNINVKNITGDYSCAIIIDCNVQDLEKILPLAGNALVTGEITVEDAELLVEQAKRKKRQDNMDVFNQLYAAGLKRLYGSQNPFFKAYDTGEILSGVTFNDIEALMVYFLNAALYSIVITGNTKNNIGSILEAAFGDLQVTGDVPKAPSSDNVIKKDETIRVKVQRVFKGDGKSGDAMPDVLVPTKVFNDPMLFFIKENEINKKVLANALDVLANYLNNGNDGNFDTVEVLKRADCVTVVLSQVRDKNKCAKLFSNSVKNIRALKNSKVIRVETY